MWCIISWLTRNTDAIPASGFLRIVILAGPGLVIGLSCFLIIILLPWLAAKQAQITIGHTSQNRLIRLWRRSLFHGQYSLFVAIILGLGIGLSTGIEQGVSNGWNYGFSYGLGYGLLCVPLRYILTKPGDNVHLIERLGWTWGNLRHSLLTTKNLCIPLAVMSISLLLFGGGQVLGPELSQGWDQRLSWGLSWGLSQSWSWSLIWGLSCWLLLGLFQSILRERLDERDCHSFNRGIHDAFRHSLLMSIASALMIGMVSILSWGFSYELSYGLHYGLSWGFSYELGYELNYGLHTGLDLGLHYMWLFALSGGVLAGVLSGGLAVLRHYILRFLLWKTGLFPWNIQPFLMDAVTRVLLLPLDGGYTFTHRLLLEYLADYTA
jgi:hypothetical protein